LSTPGNRLLGRGHIFQDIKKITVLKSFGYKRRMTPATADYGADGIIFLSFYKIKLTKCLNPPNPSSGKYRLLLLLAVLTCVRFSLMVIFPINFHNPA
jgi:hypothetical protein